MAKKKELTEEEMMKQLYAANLKDEQKVIRSLFEIGKEDLVCQNCCNPSYLVIELDADCTNGHIHISSPDTVNLSFVDEEQFERFIAELRSHIKMLKAEQAKASMV